MTKPLRPDDLPCVHIRKSDDLDNACAKSNAFWHKRLRCRSYQCSGSAGLTPRPSLSDVRNTRAAAGTCGESTCLLLTRFHTPLATRTGKTMPASWRWLP